MISDGFEFLVPGDLSTTARWILPPGATAGILINGVAPNTNASYPTAGSSKVAYRTAPTKPHQRVECQVQLDTLPPATARTGVFCRYLDASNCILGYVDHNTKTATIIERVAGVDTTLGTIAWAGGASPAGALRLEAIGRRLRVWHQNSFQVADRPPDVGYNLTEDANVGTWGIYIESNGVNNMRITRFLASGLPSNVLSPPVLVATTAPAYNFTPVTLSQTGLLTNGVKIEWQVWPADWADFPEGQGFLTDGNLSPVVAWVRPGYSYKVRARNIQWDQPLPWTDVTQFTAAGSPVATGWTSKSWQTTYWPSQAWGSPSDVTPPNAGYTFPSVAPDYVFNGDSVAAPAMAVSNCGIPSIAQNQLRPRRSFEMKFENRTASEFQLLIDFFETMQARMQPFQWVHPLTGVNYTLVFATDDYQLDNLDQSSTQSSPIVSLTLKTVEAAIGVVAPTLSVRLQADPAIT